MATDKKSQDIYRWIKIGGILSFLPFVMVAGPFAGYLLGDYLEKRFHLPHYIYIFCIIIGLAAGIIETIRMLKVAIKAENNQ